MGRIVKGTKCSRAFCRSFSRSRSTILSESGLAVSRQVFTGHREKAVCMPTNRRKISAYECRAGKRIRQDIDRRERFGDRRRGDLWLTDLLVFRKGWEFDSQRDFAT